MLLFCDLTRIFNHSLFNWVCGYLMDGSIRRSACLKCSEEGKCTAANCSRCLQPYGILHRRHHCRECGGTFCAECSKHRLRLPERGHIEKVRVCDACYQANSLDSVWERETMTVRHFLRMQPHGYSVERALSDCISKRQPPEKCHWRARSQHNHTLLVTTLQCGGSGPLRLSCPEEGAALAELLTKTLRHPFIWPTLQADYLFDLGRLVLVRPLAKRGSLRDLIHRASPQDAYVVKYGHLGLKKSPAPRGLGLNDICRFSRQVLEALNYIQSRGLVCSHLHSGNVLLDSDQAFLTDVIENELTALNPTLPAPDWPGGGHDDLMMMMTGRQWSQREGPHHSSASSASSSSPGLQCGALTSLAFGRLLFEMATGRLPQLSDMTVDTIPKGQVHPSILEVLRDFFPSKNSASFSNTSRQLPTIQSLLERPVFQQVTVMADVRFITQPSPSPAASHLITRAHQASADYLKAWVVRQRRRQEEEEDQRRRRGQQGAATGGADVIFHTSAESSSPSTSSSRPRQGDDPPARGSKHHRHHHHHQQHQVNHHHYSRTPSPDHSSVTTTTTTTFHSQERGGGGGGGGGVRGSLDEEGGGAGERTSHNSGGVPSGKSRSGTPSHGRTERQKNHSKRRDSFKTEEKGKQVREKRTTPALVPGPVLYTASRRHPPDENNPLPPWSTPYLGSKTEVKDEEPAMRSPRGSSSIINPARSEAGESDASSSLVSQLTSKPKSTEPSPARNQRSRGKKTSRRKSSPQETHSVDPSQISTETRDTFDVGSQDMSAWKDIPERESYTLTSSSNPTPVADRQEHRTGSSKRSTTRPTRKKQYPSVDTQPGRTPPIFDSTDTLQATSEFLLFGDVSVVERTEERTQVSNGVSLFTTEEKEDDIWSLFRSNIDMFSTSSRKNDDKTNSLFK